MGTSEVNTEPQILIFLFYHVREGGQGTGGWPDDAILEYILYLGAFLFLNCGILASLGQLDQGAFNAKLVLK